MFCELRNLKSHRPASVVSTPTFAAPSKPARLSNRTNITPASKQPTASATDILIPVATPAGSLVSYSQLTPSLDAIVLAPAKRRMFADTPSSSPLARPPAPESQGMSAMPDQPKLPPHVAQRRSRLHRM